MATFIIYCFTLLFILSGVHAGSIGINYGRLANNLPPPTKVVELLKSRGITRAKLYDTDEAVLKAFANTGISFVVALPNELLAATANDPSSADQWVQANIIPHHPATKIEAIAVGNEVFVDPNNTTDHLVKAMQNVHASLVKHKLDTFMKVSSPIALTALQNSYPASSGSFKQDLIEPVMKPMLDFLSKTSSYLMVNVYPFFAYSENSNEISLDYALFKDNPGVVDSGNNLKYTSLFDAQVDAVYAAMSALKYDDVKVVVTETGWPSKGDENEIGASQENAALYNGNLVKHALTKSGTPLKPKEPLDVYLFAMFNENQKPGPTSERNYGLFYPSEEKVYDIPLTLAEVNGEKSTPVRDQVPVTGGGGGHSWCVANGQAAKVKLQNALDYACGQGRADCRPIQKGATCYNPDSLEAHASYAFNSYYQKNSRKTGTCDFGGAAHVVTQPPRFGKCEFPTGY